METKKERKEMDVKLEDLLVSYLQCRSNKRNTKAALQFELDWESDLMELYRELCEDRYRISPPYCFIVENPVKREVFAAAFRDRIVHHYVVSRLEPFWEQYFIFDSYSCRKGKGTLFGANRLKRFIAQCSQGYTRLALQQWNELAESRKLTDEEVERCTQVMNSYLGLMRHHCSYRLRINLLNGMSSRLRKYFCMNTPDKIISWDHIYHKAWLSARKECYSRIRALKLKHPGEKFNFEELYNEICMERYLKSRGEL